MKIEGTGLAFAKPVSCIYTSKNIKILGGNGNVSNYPLKKDFESCSAILSSMIK